MFDVEVYGWRHDVDVDSCLEVPSVGRGDKKAIEHPHTNLSSNNVFTNGNDLGDTGAEQ